MNTVQPHSIRVGRLGVVILFIAMFFGRIHEGEVELIYACASKSILHTGDWWQMHQVEEPYFGKPPLAFWFTAILFDLFGQSVAASRMFACLTSALMVWLVYALTRLYRDEGEALLAAALLCLNNNFVSICGAGNLDGPQLAFMLVAVYGYLHAVERERPRSLIWIGVGLFLGAFSKTMFAFIALPIILIHSIVCGRWRVFGNVWFWVGLALGAGLYLPWYLSHLIHNPLFAEHHLQKQMFDIVRGEGNYAAEAWRPLGHFWEMFSRLLPWSLLAVIGFWRERKRLRERWTPPGREALFWFIWTVVIALAIYSVRRMTFKYNLPLFIPMTLWSAAAIGAWLNPERRARLPRMLYNASIVILLAVVLLPVRLRGDRFHEAKEIRPILDTILESGEPLHGYQLQTDERRALKNAEWTLFYHADRVLHDHQELNELLSFRPTVILSAREAYQRDLSVKGYRVLYERGNIVLALAPD